MGQGPPARFAASDGIKEVIVVSSAIAATKLALLPILITELFTELCTISSGDRVTGFLEQILKGRGAKNAQRTSTESKEFAEN
ncbi:MAG: hypothetical protein EBX86_03445 [Actinobacteria bacterium]|nr:hypothetical protein [Actinomycetota bacterium]NDA39130.1 hypothetical protein [Actinomycetota bacterium]